MLFLITPGIASKEPTVVRAVRLPWFTTNPAEFMFATWIATRHVVAALILLDRCFALRVPSKNRLEGPSPSSKCAGRGKLTFGQGRVLAFIQSL